MINELLKASNEDTGTIGFRGFIFMKKCLICNKLKETKEFYVNKIKKDGVDIYCKECNKKKTKEFRRSKKGLICRMYSMQKRKSKIRGHQPPSYSKKQLELWMYNNPLWNEIFNNWVKSDYDKNLTPSIDRIDDNKGYSFSNIQLMTWLENNLKAYSDRKAGLNNKQSIAVIQYSPALDTVIDEYYSISQANRETGIDNSNILRSCRNEQATAGGFKWRFKD